MPKAPRRCPGDNYTCPNTVTTTSHCPTHTRTWPATRSPSSRATSRRAWRKLTQTILARDHHQCRIQYAGICTNYADSVDHITPVARGGTNHPNNLRAACHPCNMHKSRKSDNRRPGQ